MNLSASLLPEFDHEMAGTRKTLARVPAGKFAWGPHPKSMTAGALAAHLANIPHWVDPIVRLTELDVTDYKLPTFTDVDALLAYFDEGLKQARQAIEQTEDAAWMQPWSLKGGGHTYFTLPRIAVMRSFVLNHNVHHRGQMTVYLRLMDVPVPGLYGPSADEQ